MTHVNYRLDAKLSRQAPEQLVDLDDVELVIVEPDEQDVFIIDPVTGAREAVQKKTGNSPKSVKQNVTQLSGENTPSIDTQATDKPAISLDQAEASPSVDPHTYAFLGNMGSKNPPSRTKGLPLTTVQMYSIIDAV